jgi:hypothetical protein
LGLVPTWMVALTFRVAVSMTLTERLDQLETYKVSPSGLVCKSQGVTSTST